MLDIPKRDSKVVASNIVQRHVLHMTIKMVKQTDQLVLELIPNRHVLTSSSVFMLCSPE